MSNLHGQIMNLNCNPENMAAEPIRRVAYQVGHRDARHAAAEVALAGDAAIALMSARIDLALLRYDWRSELYTNDADLIESMVDALRGRGT